MSRMKSALSFTLLVWFVASVRPVTAQKTTGTPMSFDTRGSAAHGPVAQSVAAEAVRLASERLQPFGAAHMVNASSVAAQSNTQPAVQLDADHSVWRDILIGASIGAGIGMVLGAVVDRKATCVNAVGQIVSGHCEGHYAMRFLGGDGAAVGALVGFLVHRRHRP